MTMKIFTDSCCDLPYQFVESNSDILSVISIPVQINGEEYLDDLGKTLPHEKFYGYLREQIMPTTAQINSFMFANEFRKELEKGNDVLYLCFSSGLSGTYNSSRIAVEELREEFPQRYIETIDTLSASVGLGVIILKSLNMARSGHTIEEIAKWVEENKLKTNHWFGVDNLTFLKNGGRISETKAFVGNVLNLKPTLTINQEGKLLPHTNCRGRKKSISFLSQKVVENLIDSSEPQIIVGHGNNLEDALKLKTILEETYDSSNIMVTELSMTIASHVGPDMLAVAFIGKEREH